MTNIAMENGPFIDGLPFLKMGGFSMAMLNNQMVMIANAGLELWCLKGGKVSPAMCPAMAKSGSGGTSEREKTQQDLGC